MWYLAAFNCVKFILQTLFGTGLFFIRDENESPPLPRFGVKRKLNVFNLQKETQVRPICKKKNGNSTAEGWIFFKMVN